MRQDILLRNNVKVIGNGSQPMLFAPGFGCDQSVWHFIVDFFKDDYQLILFDYVGTGNSDIQAYSEDKYRTLLGYSEDLLEICSSLDLKETIVVGHSVGSMIGMLASFQRPEYFSNLIMLGPSPCYLNDPPHYFGGFEKDDLLGLLDMMEKNYIGWANFFATTVVNNPEKPEVKHELEERFCSTDPNIAISFAKAAFFADYRKDLANVTVPTYIMQCSNDIIAPISVGQYVHKQIANSRYSLMQATGHCPHMSHPEETVTLIKNYLKKISI